MGILEEAIFHIFTGPMSHKRFIICPQATKRFFKTEHTGPTEKGPASNLTDTEHSHLTGTGDLPSTGIIRCPFDG